MQRHRNSVFQESPFVEVNSRSERNRCIKAKPLVGSVIRFISHSFDGETKVWCLVFVINHIQHHRLEYREEQARYTLLLHIGSSVIIQYHKQAACCQHPNNLLIIPCLCLCLYLADAESDWPRLCIIMS